MRRTATLLAALAVATAANAAPVRTATEAYVTNKIAAAVAAIPSPDFTTNNAALVETIQAKAPAPDFTTNNTVLVETIETTAPAPGNYSVVSNRAMNANGNFLAVDGPFFWEAEKAISLKDGFLTLDNTGTGGTTLTMTYEIVSFGYPDSATWRDIIDAANAHAAGNYTTPEDVTAAIREQSLGGIWDAELEVWWTPVMRNGSLTYQATTNVNLNAEN